MKQTKTILILIGEEVQKMKQTKTILILIGGILVDIAEEFIKFLLEKKKE